MENNNYKYYQRIRDLREDSDLKQEAVAALLDMFQSSYQRYESGKLELPMHYFIKLAKYYNVSLDYLAGLTNDKEMVTSNTVTA
ncbi:MAG: helix-turn-helix transcriptional regulator [Ruminococcaceae bacterium]|nr:helix-turn-helix transcriptional regulator [Oscillospiraceae bacterium]